MLNRIAVCLFVVAGLITLSSAADENACKGDPNQWQQLFNGKDLTGWEGLDGFWSVEDGVIDGHETKDKCHRRCTLRPSPSGRP